MNTTIKTLGAITALVLASCGGKQVNPEKKLKTSIDSFSYTVGYQVGKYMKGSGVDKIDYSALIKGIEEALKKDSGFAVSEKNLQQVQTNYMMAESDKWLADNAKKSGVVALASKGQMKMIKAGTGPAPGKWDTITCHLVVKTSKGRLMFDTKARNPMGVKSNLQELGLTPALLEAFEKAAAGSKFEVYAPMDASSPLSQYAKSFEEMYGIAIFEVEFMQLTAGKQPK